MCDTIATIQQLKDTIKIFQQERGWNPHAKNLAISIAVEAAELLEHFQWDDYEEYQKREDAKKEEIKKELADVMIYALQFAMKTNIDVTQAIENKLKINAKKYPAHLFKDKKQRNKIYYEIKAQHRKKK